MSLLSYINPSSVKLDIPTTTINNIKSTDICKKTYESTDSNKIDTNRSSITSAMVDNVKSKKYGYIPGVNKGQVIGENIDTFTVQDIEPQHLVNILQGNVEIQPQDYYKTVAIKIALDKDENGNTTHLTQKEVMLSLSLLRFYRNFRNLYIFTKLINGDSIISLRLIEYFVVNYVVDNNTVYNILHYKANPSYLINQLTKKHNSRSNKRINNKNTANTYTDEIKDDIEKHTNLQNTRKLVGEELDIMMDFDNYILVHDRYKAQLKEHSKLSFDPFCRSTRICRNTNKTDSKSPVSKSTRIYLVLPGGVTLATTIAQLNFFKWAIQDHVLEYIIDNQDVIDAAMTDYESNKYSNNNSKNSYDITNNDSTINDEMVDNIINDESLISDSEQLVTGNKTRTKKANGRRRRRGRENNRMITRYTCRRTVTFD